MNLELEDVGPEYIKQPPFVRVMLEDADEPGFQVPRLTTNNLWPVEAIKMLYVGIDMLEGDLNAEDREEIAEWLAEWGE